MAMADATPARLPVPTRVATLTAKAWNEDMRRCLGPISLTCSSTVSTAESVSTRNISPIMRNCTKWVRHVNHKPQPTNAMMST